jgi:hypothetical protein
MRYAVYLETCKYCIQAGVTVADIEYPETKRPVFIPFRIFLASLAGMILLSYIAWTYVRKQREELAHNEAMAIGTLWSICTVEELYFKQNKRHVSLEELVKEKIIPESFAAATTPQNARAGYYYILRTGDGKWSCSVIPAEPGVTGTRSFYADETGIIRKSQCRSRSDPPAGPNSPKLGQ